MASNVFLIITAGGTSPLNLYESPKSILYSYQAWRMLCLAHVKQIITTCDFAWRITPTKHAYTIRLDHSFYEPFTVVCSLSGR